MSQLVWNNAVTLCCGETASRCTCNAITPETEFASAADLASITGNRGPAVADLVPTVDDGDMLGLPTLNWEEIAKENRD